MRLTILEKIQNSKIFFQKIYGNFLDSIRNKASLLLIIAIFFSLFLALFNLFSALICSLVLFLFALFFRQLSSLVIVRKSGLIVKAKQATVVIPYLYLAPPYLQITEEQKLQIFLSSILPGVSFIVQKFRANTEGKTSEAPIQIIGDSLIIDCSCKSWKRIRQACQKQFSLLTPSLAKPGNSLIVEKTDKGKRRVMLNTQKGMVFPSFCPLTGNCVETTYNLDRSLEIPMSYLGNFLCNHSKKCRIILTCTTTLMMLSLAFYSAQRSDPLVRFLLGWAPLSAAFLLSWLLTRKKASFYLQGKELLIEADDAEYIDTLIRLNSLNDQTSSSVWTEPI